MFLQNLRAKIGTRLSGEKSESGFTLIELLVVMLILGILAAIAIPAFFNQREKASDAQAKSAARTAETAMETYATEHAGSYSGAQPSDLKTIEPTLIVSATAPNRISVSTPKSDEYTVTSTSSTEVAYSIKRESGGITKFECTPVKAGCPTGGDWSK